MSQLAFTIIRIPYRAVDLAISIFIFANFLLALLIVRIFGKHPIASAQDKVLSLSKDGVFKTIECNFPGYFDWDYTRPHARVTYLYYIGNEPPAVKRLGKKVIGINIRMPLNRMRKVAPYTTRALQQIAGFALTNQMISKTGARVIETMFPSKLSMRAMLLKFLRPIKIVTQIRGNLDLIYYFQPSPAFFPVKFTIQPFETFQLMWDKFISLLFFRSCDLVIGYNINNMLSGISAGAHPSKTKLSRIRVEPSMLSVRPKARAEIAELPPIGEIIIAWSRLTSEKQVFESVLGFERMCGMLPGEFHYVIIGDGPERQRIEEHMRNSKWKSRVHILGTKSREFIAQSAQHASLAIVPYGGGSLVEAVLLGIPVVAFDIEWHNEIIRDGETGYLADFPDAEHMGMKMEEALSNKEEANRRAQAAKDIALRMFDTDTSDAKESRYYKTLFK